MDTREYYGDDSREDMLNCLGKLTYQLKRNKGEGQRDFCARWENAVRKVKEHGVQLPPEYLGFLFIMALQLSPEEVKLLMNFSKGSLHVTDVREWLRVHETELDFKISNKEAIKTTDKKGIDLAEHVDDSLDTPEIDEADSEYEVLMAAAEELGLDPATSAPDEEIFEESDAKEILATMVRDHVQGKGRGKSGGKRTFQQASRMKKTKELSREYGRGRSGFLPTGTYRVSVEELKRKTRCSVCHQIGHWHRDRECPGKAEASKEVQLLESDEALFIHFLEYQDYKNEQQAEVHHLSRDDEWNPLQEAVSQWRAVRAAPQATSDHGVTADEPASASDRVYKERSPPIEAFWSEKCFEHLRRSDIDERSCATVDTGCQRAAIGLETLYKLQSAQPKQLEILMKPEPHRFCSVHGTSTTQRVACIPNSIGPNGCILRPAVFEDEHGSKAPFLLSLPFLLECRSVLELDPTVGLSVFLRKYNHRIPLHLGPTGALRIPLHEFTPQMLQHLQAGSHKLKNVNEHEILNLMARDCGTGAQQQPAANSGVIEPKDAPATPSHGAEAGLDSAVASIGPTTSADDPPNDDLPGLQSASHVRTSGNENSSGGQRAGEHERVRPGSITRTSTGRTGATQTGGFLPSQWRKGQEDTGLHPRTGSSKNSGAAQGGTSISGDVTEYGQQSTTSSMPLSSDDHTPDLQEGGVPLSSAVLDMPTLGNHQVLRLLHVDQGPTILESQSEQEGSHSLATHGRSADSQVSHANGSKDLSSLQRDQGRQQWMDRANSLHRLSNHPGAQTAHQAGVSCQLTPGQCDSWGSTSMGRISRVQAVLPDAAPPPLNPEVRALNPTHLHRMCASLESAEIMWQQMLQIFDDPTKHVGEELFLTMVAKDLKPTKRNLRNAEQLFRVDKSNLRMISEVFNPDRFGPATQKFGLQQGQIFDLTLGDDLLSKQSQESVLSHIRIERPGLTIISPPCGPFSALQNLSQSLRSRDWTAARKFMNKLHEARRLLRFAAHVCLTCHELGLSFLFEQPQTARSWSELCIRKLLQTRGIELVHGDQCMYGLKLKASGAAVKKPTSFMGNNPSVLAALSKRCDHSHRHEPVIGCDSNGSRSSQAQRYPPGLVNTILKSYAQSINRPEKELYFILAADIISLDRQVDEHYYTSEETAEIFAEGEDLIPALDAPFYGSQENEFTIQAKEHLPEGDWKFWTRTDLQADKYQTTKGDGPHFNLVDYRLTFNLETKELIKLESVSDLNSEDLEKALESENQNIVTVFAWQKLRELAGSRQVSLERLVRRAHEGLGHPELNRFLRILKASKVKPEILEIAKNLRCLVCQQLSMPATRRFSAPPRENLQFNDLIGVDSIKIRNHRNEAVTALNCIDYASHFQLVIPMTSATAKAARTAYRQWTRIFGAPRRMYGDLGSEFKASFVRAVEEDGTEFVPSSLESPHQRGLVERAGKTYKQILYKTMNTVPCESEEQWRENVDASSMMRNRLLLKGGYSPIQRVMGFTPRLPGELLSGRDPQFSERTPVRPGDLSVLRSMELRRSAAKAFFDSDCQNALQRATLAGPRPWRTFEPGQIVFFFRRGADTQKKPASFYWQGPARVLLVDMPNTIWLSHRNTIIKASPERIRAASEEETMTLSSWLEGLTELRDQLRRPDIRGLIDLSKEAPPTQDELGEEEINPDRDDLIDPEDMLEPRQPMLEPSERRPLTDLPEPARRVRAKTAIGEYAERSADPPGEQPAPESGAVLPPPGLAPAVDGQGQPFVSEPDLEYTPSEPPIEPELPDTEMIADHGKKREHVDDTTEDIVSPPDKRQRVEFLELFHTVL